MKITNKTQGYILAADIIFGIPFILLMTAFFGIPGIKTSILIGVAAYSLMLSNIVFATQSGKIGAVIGFNKIGWMHLGTAIAVIGFAISHNILINSSGIGPVPLLGNIAFWTLIVVFIFSFLFMSSFAKNIPFFNSINISRGVKIWLHRLNVVAALIIFFHVTLNPFIQMRTIFFWVFFAISLIVFAIYFFDLFRKIAKS